MTLDNPYTAVIREKYRDADEVTFVTGLNETPFVVCHVRHYDGKINWFNDWTRADTLVDAGILRRVFHPGHGDPAAQYVEYFYT